MKKWIGISVIILLAAGLFSLKYFTMLLDSKESAIIINKSFPFQDDYTDRKKLVEAVDNIFIGEVVRVTGTEKVDGKPNTQFLIRITQNVKGALLGEVTVNQKGGYYKDKDKLYLLSYEKTPLLKKKEMYLFAVSKSNKGYFEMMPKYGSMLLDNEDEKLEEIGELQKAMKK